MKLCVFVVLLAQFCFGDDPGNIHEYDTTRNGWYIGSSNQPIMVNLRQQTYTVVPQRYYNFVNQTLRQQPSGICYREIP